MGAQGLDGASAKSNTAVAFGVPAFGPITTVYRSD
jgi:hypothetical protein